jgi:hypothetical protein
MIAPYAGIDTYKYTSCANSKLLIVKVGDTQSYH